MNQETPLQAVSISCHPANRAGFKIPWSPCEADGNYMRQREAWAEQLRYDKGHPSKPRSAAHSPLGKGGQTPFMSPEQRQDYSYENN